MGRVEKSIRNLNMLMISQVVTIILSFISRTCLIYVLGIEAVSINSLFTQVISAISLAEMGVGTAITYNLLKPLADNDHEKISQLMGLFRTAYYIIGLATFVIGLALCPFIQYFIKDITYDISYIRIIYMMFVTQSAVSYIFSYKISLLQTDQNDYIYTRISIVFRLVGTGIILLFLLITRKYLVYLTANILLVILTDAYASHVVDRKYSYIDKKAKLPRDERNKIFANIRNIFMMLFAGRVVDSTDNILISTLISTILVGIYSNYMVVIGVFKQLSDKLIGATHASMGNLFVTEETERKMSILTRMTFILFVFALIASAGIYASIQPFIILWLGKEEYLLDKPVVLVLVVVAFTSIVYEPLKVAMRLTGYFDIGRNISFVSAVTNLIVSVILGRMIGISGIFIGTMSTYIVEIVSKTYYLYRTYFRRSASAYVMMWVKMVSVLAAELVIIQAVDFKVNFSPLPQFLIMGSFSVVLSAIFILVFFRNTEDFAYTLDLVRDYLRKVVNKLGFLTGGKR